MKVIESLTDANNALSSIDRSLVCFTARWCPPCRMINLAIESFEEEHVDANIYKIDVHQFKELAEELNATAVPVTFVVENGHIVKSIKGFIDSDDLAKIYYEKE